MAFGADKGGCPMKILLVDDSGTMRHIERQILTELGLTDVKEAGDGAQALKEVELEKYDLILMDWNMPKVTGLEALKRLKANPSHKEIPVVMITSESEKSHILDAIRAGAANYLLKPFSAETLKEKIAPFLVKKGP
jgi:two-component system, chemotaxis family, chemotaxis protein CheY